MTSLSGCRFLVRGKEFPKEQNKIKFNIRHKGRKVIENRTTQFTHLLTTEQKENNHKDLAEIFKKKGVQIVNMAWLDSCGTLNADAGHQNHKRRTHATTFSPA
ncbi:hypothetical protein LZ30DRAFT_688742 [Colletotrichum cereale]|nr:hypothetical protein LZ30DRAFT_688742 [Colletotrichum cereale]